MLLYSAVEKGFNCWDFKWENCHSIARTAGEGAGLRLVGRAEIIVSAARVGGAPLVKPSRDERFIQGGKIS